MCDGLGISATQNCLDALVSVCVAEGSEADYNPFDTTLETAGATDYNDVGVKNYPSLQEGIDAAVSTLSLPAYAGIVDAMKVNAPASVIAQAWATSPWGTGSLVIRVLPEVQARRPLYYTAPIYPLSPPTQPAGGGEATVTPSLPTPPPAPSTIEVKDMPQGSACEDKMTNGTWVCTPNGAVFAYDNAPYLGGLNNHPDWQAGTHSNPAIAIAPWWGDGTPENGQGYVIVCWDGTANAPSLYRFPRGGGPDGKPLYVVP